MDDLGIAIVGGGFMGRAHSLAYALSDIAAELGIRVRKQVLVETTEEHATAAADQLGWAESATDWREVVAREDIAIIDICTPPQFHEEIALAAIKHGKHVFCEKPITNSAATAERMSEAVRAAGVVAQIGFNYRYTPAISFAKRLLDEGRLGQPLQFRASYLQSGGFRADPNRWRAQRHTGGSGIVGDIGSHIIDIAEYLFGDIARVSGTIRSKDPDAEGWAPNTVTRERDLIDDAGVWIAEFESGAIGAFTVNYFASGKMNQIYFGFDATKGSVEFDWNKREEFRVAYVDEPADHLGFRTVHTNDQHPNGWWRLAGLGTGYVEIMAIQFQEFIRAVARQGKASPDFACGARIQRIVEAVHESARSRRWVEIAPQDSNGLR